MMLIEVRLGGGGVVGFKGHVTLFLCLYTDKHFLEKEVNWSNNSIRGYI